MPIIGLRLQSESRSVRKFKFWPVAICAALFLFWFVGKNYASGRSERAGPHVRPMQSVGIQPLQASLPESAREFEVLGSGKADFSDYSGRLVLVNFWATWCEPCKLEMPSMDVLYQRYRDSGLVVLAFNYGEDSAVAESYVDELAFSFPTAIDSDTRIGAQFGVRALPTSYLISPLGEIVGVKVGTRFWDTDEVFDAFDNLLEVEWTHPE